MLRNRFRDDDGQGLITVLFTTMIVLALVVAATTITAAQSVPASQAVDRSAALAAAEGGVQDFLAQISGACPLETDDEGCALITDGETRHGTIGGTESSFEWTVLNATSYTTDGHVRVKSVGTYQRGSAKPQTRTLYADVVAGAQLSDFLYYSTYETQSARLINAQNPPRTIAFDHGTEWNVGGSDVEWDGARAYAGSEFPNSSVCDALWYDNDGVDGRHTRNASQAFGDTIVDWGETGSVGGAAKTRGGACEVMFSADSHMTGDVYSKDALLISSSVDRDGSGPQFDGKVWTEWSEEDSPAANGSRRYRPFAPLPDSAPAVGSSVPQRAPTNVALPLWQAPTSPTCTYTGATRVRVEGSDLVITSPGTPAGEGACYTSAPDNRDEEGPTIGDQPSVLDARVPVAGGATILVNNAEDYDPNQVFDTPTAPQSETDRRDEQNSLFFARGQQGDLVYQDPVYVLYEAVPGLPDDAPDADEHPIADARSEFEGLFATNVGDFSNALIEKLDTAQDSATPLEAQTDKAIREALSELLADRDDLDFEFEPDAPIVRVTIDDEAAGSEAIAYSWHIESSTKEPVAESEDPAIEHVINDETESHLEEVAYVNDGEKATATFARLECASDECIRGVDDETDPTEPGAAGDIDIFSADIDQQNLRSGKRVTPVRAFPLPGDRAAYDPAAGDVYIDGELDGSLSIVAENDIVVMGDLTQANTHVIEGDTDPDTFTSGDALALVANRDVSVYHPVACTSANNDKITATSAGFCPNDLTGLFDILSIDDPNHPSRQYHDLASGDRQIDAAIYALGGSFALANHDKGTDLGTLHLNGAVYQEHRGAMGVEWAITRDQHTRPRSGYALDYTYDSTLPTKQFPFVPSDGRTHVGAWTLVGTSEILNEEGNE